jgi:putative FmdB family regulatory protein
MPTYEYRCNACGRDFEYQQKMADPDLVKCEVCGEDKLEKLISWSAFQLKGGGWYKDLYASQSPADQKQAAKDSVDKGVPPKKDDSKPASTDTAAAKPAGEGGGGAASGGSPASGGSTPAPSGGSTSGSTSGSGSTSSGSTSKE